MLHRSVAPRYEAQRRGCGGSRSFVEENNMAHSRLWIAALAILGLATPAWADPDARADARVLAAKIDQLIASRWQAEHVLPAPLADEGAYLRRLSLDVIGRIPLVSETRLFL